MKFKLFFGFLIFIRFGYAQTDNHYEISFKEAVHHEAKVVAIFSNLENKVLSLRMSRTSPGRYALHEFAKNVYNVEARDSKGNQLVITRPNAYQWNVSGHDGTVKISYSLFANRGGGTYTQIDETHAHLNIPATFMYAKNYTFRPISVKFNVRKDLNWKVATQLKDIGNGNYYAPDLDYFMDSPTEISNFSKRSFTVSSKETKKIVHFILHHNGTEEEFDEYLKKVKKIVLQEMAVYGELPNYDFGEYTFLACYVPNASGDGMEHRNSTILTSTRSLSDGGMDGNIGTVAHEFFHSWNVERIRPTTLEPFNYEETNMSGELWFAEGFTSYYTNLILCRTGLISHEMYAQKLSAGLNYVWNSPATLFFNPIEMSYQAPFVDAARSVDPVNRENTFISYYTYGSVLGLALDLSLRNLNSNKNLDGFMRLVWVNFGKTEIQYTIRDLQNLLASYAGNEFSTEFFSKYIFKSGMPDYKSLLGSVGINFNQKNKSEADFGALLQLKNNQWTISSNPIINRAAYKAGLSIDDEILTINDKPLNADINIRDYLTQFQPNQTVIIKFKRYNLEKITELTFNSNLSYVTSLNKNATHSIIQQRNDWLKPID
jgi:predicted metalloprotease with PDZ domain